MIRIVINLFDAQESRKVQQSDPTRCGYLTQAASQYNIINIKLFWVAFCHVLFHSFWCFVPRHGDEIARLRELEEEQDMLNTSLLSLTTHFAQVQFRLKQIISAPQEHKEVNETFVMFYLRHVYWCMSKWFCY